MTLLYMLGACIIAGLGLGIIFFIIIYATELAMDLGTKRNKAEDLGTKRNKAEDLGTKRNKADK